MIESRGGVRILRGGDELEYADGAENEILRILASVSDRSSGSDELVRHINDWPTRYHLARQRENLLRPLKICRGMKVLDVGAGTGALTRFLAESGADVVALEGSLARARAAALRCDEFDNVRVLCGSVDQLDDGPFDLVLVVGVLEYADHSFGGGLGADSFLRNVRRLAGDHGAVGLAIENQLGLKYLLGYAEDHLGVPWVGIEGYPRPGIRTYSRRELAKLLAAADLPARRWLYPFPDYKLPRVVVAEEAFLEPDAAQFVDQLVGNPVDDHAGGPEQLCDARSAARVLTGAGLGQEVANSFFVLAGAAKAVEALVPDQTLVWHFGSERLRVWSRSRYVVRAESDGRSVITSSVDGTSSQRSWLCQNDQDEEVHHKGPTVERLVLDACAAEEVDTARVHLEAWRRHLMHAASHTTPVEEPPNPFVRKGSTELLPGHYLDIGLSNFIRLPDGRLAFVDREWEAVGGVELDLAAFRALWYFAHRVVTSGARMPWSPSATVNEVATSLVELAGFEVSGDLLSALADGESELQTIVRGGSQEEHARRHRDAGIAARVSLASSRGLPYAALRRDAATLAAQLDAATRSLSAAEERLAALEGARTELENHCVEQDAELLAAHAELDRVARELQLLRVSRDESLQHLARLEARQRQFEARRLVRLYRVLTRRPSAV